MKPLVPLFVAACLGAPAAAHADVYLKVEADGSLTLTDEARGGYERVAGAPGASHVPRPAAGEAPGGLPYASLVAAAAAAHDVPEALLHAVIGVESNYDPQAVSPKGALGLMQLMPGTARELGVADARDPAANVDAGARYLKRLLQQFGNDLALALAAYNAGPAAVARHGGGAPPYAETRRYVPRVIELFRRLQTRLPG